MLAIWRALHWPPRALRKHFKARRLCQKGRIKMFSQARVFVWLIIATFGCLSQFGSTPVGAEEAWRADTQWIDAKTCAETLPYIQMSKDVYGDEAGPEIPQGWRRLDNWEAVFSKAGSANLIEDAKAVLLVGAVFGRLHGASGDKNAAIGRLCGNHECRVVPGLLFFSLIYRGGGDRHRLRALPLIALAIRVAFPASPFFWALLGPAPVLIYTVLLATTEQGGMSRFTRTLLIAVGAIYVVMATLGLMQK